MSVSRELEAVLAECEAAQQARVPWWQVARTVAPWAGQALRAEPWEPVDRWEYDVAKALGAFLRADLGGALGC